MTSPAKRINPFIVPHFEDGYMRPLRPFEHASHADLYLAVDDSQQQFDRFTQYVRNMRLPPEAGRLIVVTGDTGCGKSALINRCVHHLADRLRTASPAMSCPIIDVTSVLDTEQELTVSDRMDIACDEIVDDLRGRRLIGPDDLTELDMIARSKGHTNRTFKAIGRCMTADQAMIVLLPRSELTAELIGYAKALRPRIFIFAESAFLDDQDIDQVVRDTEMWTTPLHLRVGQLNPGDVRLFVQKRMTDSTQRGQFPRMRDGDIDTIASRYRSIAHLQREIARTFQYRLDSGLSYRDEDWIDLADFRVANRWGATS